MSIIPPAPSSSRGNIVVQPAYFTSNLYVNAIRDDLMTLSHKYIQCYNADSSKPFQLFKDLWKGTDGRGCNSKHLTPGQGKRFSAPPRLRPNPCGDTHPYTDRCANRPITVQLTYVFRFAEGLGRDADFFVTQQLSPLQPYVTYVIQKLMKDEVFDILPTSELHPLNPRVLPREYYQAVGTLPSVILASKRKSGRPSKHEKASKAQDALDKLDKWLADTSYTPPAHAESTTHQLLSTDPVASRLEYQKDKSELLKELTVPSPSNEAGQSALEHANQFVLMRVRKLEEDAKKRGWRWAAKGAFDDAGSGGEGCSRDK
ncbi:ribonuclease [Salix suchowensis]|nr:ribonuclease [Salix suchowensis]